MVIILEVIKEGTIHNLESLKILEERMEQIGGSVNETTKKILNIVEEGPDSIKRFEKVL
jgi:hypothetical protein